MEHFLPQLLFNSVRRAPDSVALVHQGRHVSYRRLGAEANAVAAFLRRRELKPGDRVGLLMENRPEYVSIYYGIQAAGGVVVALNPADRARTFLSQLGQAGAVWLFADGTHDELAEVVHAREAPIQRVILGNAGWASDPPDHPWESVIGGEPAETVDHKPVDPDGLAQLIYTSGTTALPKAVMLSHRNLVSNVGSIVDYLELTERDSVCNVLPFQYAYGNSVLHTHLAVGGRIVLENSLLYPHDVLRRIGEERVTGFSGVPSTFALLLGRTNLLDFDLGSLRYITQAGGPMPPAGIERFCARVPHVRFFVMYGQTEATARLTYLPPERLPDKAGSCGIPIPGVEIQVRGLRGEVLQAGATGEIWARGDNVMLGYWRHDEATRDVLQNGWLRTGDLAYWDDDGFLFIRGRISEIVKSGAHRICPLEIEEVIAEVDGVAEVAVTGVPDEILGQVLRAAIVPATTGTVDPQTVKRHCVKHLARYKVPRHVEIVRGLPRSASGKIQRRRLEAGS